MPTQDPLTPSLQVQFQTEKLSRKIQECDDIYVLRAIALELLQLYEKKSAIAQWETRRAAEAENKAINTSCNRDKFEKS